MVHTPVALGGLDTCAGTAGPPQAGCPASEAFERLAPPKSDPG